MTNDAARALIAHHVQAFVSNDLDAVMSDFTSESILITRDGTFKGLDAIRAYFAKLMKLFPLSKSKLMLDTMSNTGNLIYIVWHAETPLVTVPLASDTIVVKDGKIHQHTFIGEVNMVERREVSDR